MSILNEQSGYNDALVIYNKNKNKNWNDWLQFEKLFKHQGRQGITGLMTLKENSNIQYVIKLSKYIDYLTKHEQIIMNDLNEIADYCPNFPHSFGLISCVVDPKLKKGENPFSKEQSTCLIKKEALLIEYINNSQKLYDYIINEGIDNQNAVFSIVKQVLSSILLAQINKNLTHYDLQSNNILVRPCDKDLVFFYIIDEETYFCIPTHGYFPVIIDYGFSYSKGCENNSLNVSLEHSNLGFTSCIYDEISDPKLFLWTVSSEINSVLQNNSSQILRNICKNNYDSIPIDRKTGWTQIDDNSIIDNISDQLKKYYSQSKTFLKCNSDCFNIIQNLITLPITEQKQGEFEFSFATFISEFKKIENEISSVSLCLYILKGIIDAAKEIEDEYINGSRFNAVNFFRFAILERIDSIAHFCNPKSINYEKMLCSLFCFKNAMEGVMFDLINQTNDKQEQWYKEVPLHSLNEVITAIDTNIEDEYIFNKNTQILIIDGINKNCYAIKLIEDEIIEINKSNNKSKTLAQMVI